MFSSKIKIRKALHDRIKLAAEELGCVSIEEFVEQVLQREVDSVLDSKVSSPNIEQLANNQKEQPTQKEVDEITAKLKGLGYID